MKVMYVCECCGDLLRVDERANPAPGDPDTLTASTPDLVCVDALCGDCRAELGMDGGSTLDSLTSVIH